MISQELMNLLIQVITSWQVIAVVIVVALYVSLVSFAARTYRRPRFVSMLPAKQKKRKPAAASAKDSASEDTTNEELGLED